MRAVAVLAVLAGVELVLPAAADASGGLDLYVGYMDTHTAATSSRQPDPWPYTDPSRYIGTPCPDFGSTNACWDASALRLVNTTSGDITGVRVTVRIGSHTFDLWGSNLTVKAGRDLVLTETGSSANSENFDGSDYAPNAYNGGNTASCENSGAHPTVSVTIGGSTTTYTDTGQVLNGGGVDDGHCVDGVFVPGRVDESHPWTMIGTASTGGGGSGSQATAPSRPRGLAAAAGDGSVTLTWNPPSSTGGSVVSGYRVLRSSRPGAEVVLGSTTKTRYTDKTAANGTAYFYKVVAVNGVGSSPSSAEVSATPRAASTSPQPSGGAGVCAGLRGCRVLARADINGDGHRDAVAMARRAAAVVVRVKTGPGEVVQTRRRLRSWTGSPWAGVARLDGRPGKEVLLGRLAVRHARYYQVVTWRRGRLQVLDAPGRARWWRVASSARVQAGWLHRPASPAGTIRQRVATKSGGAYQGRIRTYRWSSSGWRPSSSVTVRSLPDAQALRWGRFVVRGFTQN
jgi:hypothetical protein